MTRRPAGALLAALVLLAGDPSPAAPESPGATILAEGVLSTPLHEWAPALSPDGREIWLAIADPNFISATRAWTLVRSRRVDGAWQRPEVAPFSGVHADGYPSFSPDGRRLYFASSRPVDGRRRRDFDLWYVERAGDGWSEPRRLGEPINTEANEMSPSVTADGILYFSSDRPGGLGGMDLYRARLSGGEAESLGLAVNTPADERDVHVRVDGGLLLFVSRGHAGGVGGDDVLFSIPEGGGWSAPRNPGPRVNSPAAEMSPSLSPDGRELLFASRRGFGERSRPQALGYAELLGHLRGTHNNAGNLYRAPLAALDPSLPAGAQEPPPPHPYARRGPLSRPVLFGEGVISTDQFEGHAELTPDGREVYFTIYNRGFSFDTIVVSRFESGRWTTPEVAPFSGRWNDVGLGLSPDGRSLFFSSSRPREGDPARTDLDLWVVERTETGWSEPRNLGPGVNSPADDYTPSLAGDGTLYFCSTRPGGQGGYDIYRARPLPGGGWAAPENLGAPVNTEFPEWNVWVSPDQRLLLFMSAYRPGGVGGDDIWASWRRESSWTPPVNVRAVNTPDNDYTPKLSPDGRYLIYGSNTFPRSAAGRPLTYDELVGRLSGALNGAGNVWIVDAAVLPPPPSEP